MTASILLNAGQGAVVPWTPGSGVHSGETPHVFLAVGIDGSGVARPLLVDATGALITAGGGGNGGTVVVNSAALDSAFGSDPGSLLYRGPTGWVELAIGTNGQVLGVVGGEPVWENLPAQQTFTLNSSAMDGAFGNTQGAFLYRGSGGWTEFAHGADGQVLASSGGVLVWEDLPAPSVSGAAVLAVSSDIVNPVTTRALSGYTLVQGDNNKSYASNDTTAAPLTLPPGLTVGTVTTIYQGAAGQVQFAPGNGMTLLNSSGNTRSRAAGAPCQVRLINSTTWLLSGDTAP